ncbi:MAG: hypothetical protein K8H84_09980 [Sulfuricella denitrificans]|nr:hypothetical protein [Sulfuricella denitrificans]
MRSQSPFSLNRFEYESRHLYYLQKELFERLEDPKPIYLVGSRGTGKTTLLKALNWEERRDNRSLQDQIATDPFAKKYIGVYLKLPEIQFDVLRRWLYGREDEYAVIFSFFLDLIWLEELIDAISELIVNDIFDISADIEQARVKDITDEFVYTLGADGRRPSTLKDLSRRIRNARETIEILGRQKPEPTDVIEKFRIVGQVGEFGRRLGELLQELCVTHDSDKNSYKQWHFKICMDEGECLDSFQQRIINTMLRVSRAPVFLVVSYVSMPSDLSTTLVNNFTLQSADRELIPLDSLSEKDFLELAEGVATIRSQAISGDNNAVFRTRITLGELDINQLLQQILSSSVSPTAKKLLETGKALAENPFFLSKADKTHRTSLPIYEAYLIEKLNLEAPSPTSEHWERRKDTSAGFRKKFVASYLSICADIETEVRYASADMVLQMSDMCIRDFLHQLDAIYECADWELPKFLSTQVPMEVQNKAIKIASEKKYRSIPKSGVSEPSAVGAIIDGLARLTAIIQSRSSDGSHLRSTERGIFLISNESLLSLENEKSILQTIKDAAEAGFLRIDAQDKNELRFRVHTSLAARYGFSYRGAYYPLSLEWRDLNELMRSESEAETKKAVNVIAGRLDRSMPENLSLFDEINDE